MNHIFQLNCILEKILLQPNWIMMVMSVIGYKNENYTKHTKIPKIIFKL
jgi:hypothetical protein